VIRLSIADDNPVDFWQNLFKIGQHLSEFSSKANQYVSVVYGVDLRTEI